MVRSIQARAVEVPESVEESLRQPASTVVKDHEDDAREYEQRQDEIVNRHVAPRACRIVDSITTLEQS
jgi:hypothetical protein